jgi:protein-tyrosine phosphatase
MARDAVDSGIATIAATPHLRADFPDVHLDQIATRCDDLRGALKREQIPLELVPGAEVSLPWALEATDEHLTLASYGQRGTDLLIETPFAPVVGLDRFLYQLRARGYRVTLGHPERGSQFLRDSDPLGTLVDQGVLLQINADSLLGPEGGRGPKRLARNLLTSGLVHVIASDGHRGSSWRPVTRLAEAVEAAAELVGPDRAQWMAEAAPRAITRGEELPPPPPLVARRRRRRLFGLR